MKAQGSVSDVLADIGKKHGLKIGSMSDVVDDVVGLTTGNLSIDWVTGVGGLPLGRIVELYGQPSSGKTTTALQAAATLQQQIIAGNRDEHILYLDFEHAIDGEYAANLGLDVEHPSFILVQPNWLEDGADISEKLLKTGKVRLSIWDSIAEMTPKELEFGVRTNAMERARLMNSLLQRHNSLLHENNCAGVFLNHMTEAIQMGGRPGMPPQETSPGGKAIKFYSSLRLAFKQIVNVSGKAYDPLTGQITKQTIATVVRVRATKNKLAPPFRECEVRVNYGKGFDNFWSAMEVIKAHQAVTLTTAGHCYFDKSVPSHPDMPASAKGDRRYLHGEPALLAFADEHPEWRDQVIEAAAALIATAGSGIESEPTDEEVSLIGPSLLDS